MLPEEVEEREENPAHGEKSRRGDAVLAPQEEYEHGLRRDAVQWGVLRLRPLLDDPRRGHRGSLGEVDQGLDQVAQVRGRVDELEHRGRGDAEQAKLQEEAARLHAPVDEGAEHQLGILDPVQEVFPHGRAVEVTQKEVHHQEPEIDGGAPHVHLRL